MAAKKDGKAKNEKKMDLFEEKTAREDQNTIQDKQPEIQEEKLDEPQKEKEKVTVSQKRMVMICHFCGNKQYETNSKDPTSFWCSACGRCNEMKWQEETE